jgi:transposase
MTHLNFQINIVRIPPACRSCAVARRATPAGSAAPAAPIMKGFVVLPRRWVVESTFSWFGRNRRLAKDFENLAETLATFVTLACIQLAVRRLASL